MLRLLKTIHTIIWMILTTANFTGFYLAFIGKFNLWFTLCALLIGGEIVVIVANDWHCPLTDVTAKYTSERQPNFDIYLPEWLARHNIRIFGVLIALEVAAVVVHRFP